MVTDAAGVILRVNPAFTETTGYSAAEAIGRDPSLLRSSRNDANFFPICGRNCCSTASGRANCGTGARMAKNIRSG